MELGEGGREDGAIFLQLIMTFTVDVESGSFSEEVVQ